ncbi:hypothetical protein [Hoeflea sp.]|uniref:hypothetical protein n=1 Tax=Hoeflea sp. TaxID=1940281 RepID=UPI003B020D25
MRANHSDVRVRLGAVEVTHGDPWPVREAAQAIAHMFDERAAGDGSAAQQSASFQPFAISPDGQPHERPDGLRAGDRGGRRL